VAEPLEQAATPPLAKIKTSKPALAKPVPNPAPQPVSRPGPKLEPKPKPVALPEPARTAFVVQLAALSDAARAGALKDRAAIAGLPVHIDQEGALTRVRVGPFATREAAAAAAAKLAKIGVTGQVMAQ
jgi:DedD protein